MGLRMRLGICVLRVCQCDTPVHYTSPRDTLLVPRPSSLVPHQLLLQCTS